MTFQQFGAMKCARMFGGLTALALLLTVSACDQSDPFSPASAQSTEVIGPNGTGPDGITEYGSSFEEVGSLSNAQTGTVESGMHSTAFGYFTTASGDYSTALGKESTASGIFSIAIGTNSVAAGKNSIALGFDSRADGNHSTAIGASARAVHKGSFVYADAGDEPVTSSNGGQFMVRASGGTIFYSNKDMTAGVELAPHANAWSSLSDAASKENYRDLDGETVLEKLAAMQIQEWNYISQDAEIRHVGPTAQDFYAAFGLGEDEKRISTIDADGIALVAIQALERRNSELRETVERHEQELDRLNQRLERLERALLDR